MKKQEAIENKEIGNTILKKRFIETTSSDEKTIKLISTNLKEEVKNSNLKDEKSFKKDQEMIMSIIENNNIQNHVQEMLKKFNPPKCTKCENRTADRVCVNKTCSRNNFMQLICGKCHSNEHQDSINKPEMDVEEYFIKLVTFLNDQIYKTKSQYQSINPNLEVLTKCLEDINRLRSRLNDLKQQLKIEVEDYQKPQETHNNLSNCITKALSLCEYDNIQDQLNIIKKYLLFQGNQFTWNDCHEKYKNMNEFIDILNQNTMDVSKSINKSLHVTGLPINLCDVNIIKSNIPNYNDCNIQTKLIDNQLFMTNNSGQSQIYLDYKLDKQFKYKIRFRFEQLDSYYITVGVIPLSKVNQWATQFESHFCKIFFNNAPSYDCSRVLKGQDIRNMFKKGDQFEMRIDFENYYMDVYDYPDMKNINANQLDNNVLPDESFVLAVAMNSPKCIVLESIEEIDEIIHFQ